jgi:hypothetical protein
MTTINFGTGFMFVSAGSGAWMNCLKECKFFIETAPGD